MGAFGLAVEMIIANKHPTIGCGMDMKHATTFQYCYLFVEGAIGTVCLAITTSLGGGLYEMSTYTICAMLLCAFNMYLYLVLLGYSIRIGVAGVAVSISNTHIPIHTAISSLFLRQIISVGQVMGIIATVVGICMLAMGDMLLERCRKTN